MKGLLLAGASGLALAAGAAWLMRRPSSQVPRLPGSGAATRNASEITRLVLQYFVIPIWMAAGLADWLCHRASDIEHTGGVLESLLHLLMLAEVGVPTLGALFLEVTSP